MERMTLLSFVLLLSAVSSFAGPVGEPTCLKELLIRNEHDLKKNEIHEPEIPFNETNLGFKEIRYRIMGGSEAAVGEFPWQVSIQSFYGHHFCGGSILDETHIITACHCIVGKSASGVLVVAGAHNMKNRNENTQQRIGARRLIGHPNYNNRRINYDSAIIELKRPLKFNERVQPIRLPPLNHEPFGECVTSGWGNANPFGLGGPLVIIPNYLKAMATIMVPRNLCRIPYLFGTRSWLSDHMLCGTNGLLSGSCEGDSGGPLICYDLPGDPKPYLAGLTSFGVPPCNNVLYPSVYTNVASQRDFIEQYVDLTIYTTQATPTTQSTQGTPKTKLTQPTRRTNSKQPTPRTNSTDSTQPTRRTNSKQPTPRTNST